MPYYLITATLTIVGHNYPVLCGFKGGRGLATVYSFSVCGERGNCRMNSRFAEFMGMGSVYHMVQRFSVTNLFDKRRADSKKGEKS